ncbi:MAG: hypothetical protein ACYTAS_10245 [Planctomycetota bacterium]
MGQQQFAPMSVGRILDRSFMIYRRNFVRFITIVALIQIPVALISAVSMSFRGGGIPMTQEGSSEQTADEAETSIRGSLAREGARSPNASGLAFWATMVSALLAVVGNMLSQAALTKSVSESYLNREITVGQAYRYVLPKLVTLIGASLSVGLIVGCGCLLLVVPGVIFSLWFALTTPCIVVEDCGVLGGMFRSKTLASGNLGKVFGLGLLVALLTWGSVLVIGRFGGLGLAMLLGDNMVLRAFVGQVMAALGQILITPVGAGAFILLYYDLRIRKEGFDLEMLAQSMSSESRSGGVAQRY